MEAVLDSASVPEHLKCPICCEVPLGKVLQCKDGHVICESCLGKLPSPKQCPQCRVEFGQVEIRNRHIEERLDELSFPCPFTPKGCGERLGRGQIQSHAKRCPFLYRRKSSLEGSVSICDLLGYSYCAFQMRRNFTSEVILHLRLHHNRNLVSSEWPDFPENFATIEEQVTWVMSASAASPSRDVAPSAPPISPDSPLLSSPSPSSSQSASGPVNCSDCSKAIREIAYQCLQCVSYLLCKNCHGKDKHRHMFAVSRARPGNHFRLLDTRSQAVIPNNMIEPEIWSTKVVDEKTKSDLSWYLTRIEDICDNRPRCKGRMTYVCLECSPNHCVKMCKSCYTKGFHSGHIYVAIPSTVHFAFFVHFMVGMEQLRNGWGL